MWLQDETVMINRATVTKFGIELGEATIVFRRQPSAAEARGDGTGHDEARIAAQ